MLKIPQDVELVILTSVWKRWMGCLLSILSIRSFKETIGARKKVEVTDLRQILIRIRKIESCLNRSVSNDIEIFLSVDYFGTFIDEKVIKIGKVVEPVAMSSILEFIFSGKMFEVDQI